MNCIDRGSHMKSRKVRLRYERLHWPVNNVFNVFFFCFCFFVFLFPFFLAAVGSGGVRARPKPAEFPLLRKVPLTSAVSEILKRIQEYLGSRQECGLGISLG